MNDNPLMARADRPHTELASLLCSRPEEFEPARLHAIHRHAENILDTLPYNLHILGQIYATSMDNKSAGFDDKRTFGWLVSDLANQIEAALWLKDQTESALANQQEGVK